MKRTARLARHPSPAMAPSGAAPSSSSAQGKGKIADAFNDIVTFNARRAPWSGAISNSRWRSTSRDGRPKASSRDRRAWSTKMFEQLSLFTSEVTRVAQRDSLTAHKAHGV